MGMSSFYGPPKPEEEMIELIHKAVEHGIILIDTSDMYGPHTNEILVGKALKGIRDKVQLCTKFAISWGEKGMEVRGDPEYVRASCEGSLKRLDVEYIDLYYQHRVDNKVPIEITMGELKKLVQEGKIKYIGLSEASAADIRRAHAVHPITAIQLEYSLWTRDVEEDIIPTCRYGAGYWHHRVQSFRPWIFSQGKTWQIWQRMISERFVKNHPRFSSENFQQNKRFYEKLVAMGAEKNCTAGQLALAWVQHKGAVAIPGTTKWENLQQNIASLDVKLTPDELNALEEAVPHQEVQGDRYADMSTTWRDNVSPPLDSWTDAKH
ncbi:hypothetical protein Mapa_016984 [Marchantia paleacea]|nr:hypothetical protein Mapa_016984 [Marchantia paleacea]